MADACTAVTRPLSARSHTHVTDSTLPVLILLGMEVNSSLR